MTRLSISPANDQISRSRMVDGQPRYYFGTAGGVRPVGVITVPANAIRTDPAQALADAWASADGGSSFGVPFVWELVPEVNQPTDGAVPCTRPMAVLGDVLPTGTMVWRALEFAANVEPRL